MSKLQKIAIKLKNISKIFPNGKIANKNINLELKYGEIHALLGENGSGKSTLVKIMFGEYKATNGTIEINGKYIPFHNMEISNLYKMGIVHQHFSLIEDFSIYENIILGNERKDEKTLKKLEGKFNKKIDELNEWLDKKGNDKYKQTNSKIYKDKLFELISKKYKKTISWFSSNKENYKKLEKIIKKYKFKLDLKERIKDISIGQQQKTEILKLLSKKSEIIIFDEPTSVLTLDEIQQFLKSLKKYKQAGKAILFITHKIDEIKNIADKVSIIRHGKLIGTYNVKKITINQMISKMVEGEKIFDFINFKRKVIIKEKRLIIKKLNLFLDDKRECLHNINLEVNKGEIVGIAGIENNGQKNLLEVISGMEKRIDGKIYYNGNTNLFSNDFDQQFKPWVEHNVQTLRRHGISYIPRDRMHEALIKEEPLYINLCFNSLQNKDFFSGSFHYIQNEKIKIMTKTMCNKYNVEGVKNVEDSVDSLSGGNQQKFIIGRELLNKPNLLLIDQPTWGIDKVSIGFIYKEFLKLRNEGKSILFTSTDLNEILTLSDRVLVMSKGKMMGEVNPKQKDAAKKISKLITKTI